MKAECLRTDVDAVCDQLSAALGWRIDYVASTEHPVAAPNAAAFLPAEESPRGRMRVRHSLAATPRVEHSHAVAAAQAVSDLLQRLYATQSTLDTRSKEVSTLLTLNRPHTRPETLTSALNRLVAGAAELTGFWGAALFLIDPLQDALRLRSVARIERTKILLEHRPLSTPTPDAQALLQGAIVLNRDDPQAVPWLPAECQLALAVPVPYSEGPLGTLWCYDRRRRPIRPPHVQALQSVAAQISRTIERSVLQRDNATRKRLHQELRIASGYQARSRQWPAWTPNRGIALALRTATASELSGDLCEIAPLGDTKTFFALGDAVGHGITAAMVMAVARGAVRALWETSNADHWQPDVLISRINRTLCSATAAEQFMSLFTAIVDEEAMTLTYANAGHPPPWLLRRGTRIALKSHGMLCGVLPEAVYQQSEVLLKPRDLLVFFTDGVSEALSPQRQLLRAEGVLDALDEMAWSTAEEAATAIWNRLQRHVQHGPAQDDQTLMVMQVQSRS